MTIKLITINPKDNVAIALTEILPNQMVEVEVASRSKRIRIKQKIPKGHKISLEKISKGHSIIKYGEIIGCANRDISEGEHVHVHNLIGGDAVL